MRDSDGGEVTKWQEGAGRCRWDFEFTLDGQLADVLGWAARGNTS